MTDDDPLLPPHAVEPEKPYLRPRDYVHVKAAAERLDARAFNPGVHLRSDGERWIAEAPFDDQDAWESMIYDAFGTRSESTARAFIDQLQSLCPSYWEGDRYRPDEWALNAAVSMIATCKPESEMQAALCAQMVAIHLLTMKVAAWGALETTALNPVSDRTVSNMTRLARTYAQQMETLAKLQRKGATQEIRVTHESHVHYHHHDERHVHMREGGAGNGGRAHELAHGQGAGGDARRAPLPRAEPSRDALPGAGEQGPEALPATRRGGWFRRAKG